MRLMTQMGWADRTPLWYCFFMSSELLRISRPILRPDHLHLRANIPEINLLGDLSIKWRRLGETGITLIERGQYEQAVDRPSSRLKTLGVSAVEASIKQALPSIEGADQRLEVEPKDVDFMGSGPYVSIAYILDTAQPCNERTSLTRHIDRLSGTIGKWSEFEPHMTVATIPRAHATDEILDAFWVIAPGSLTFLEVQTAVV